MKVAILIPALNEAATIACIVSGVGRYGTPIVVDDGSVDGTDARAEAAGATVVRHSATRGYDAALATGFAAAEEMGLDAVVTFDADGQFDPDVVAKVLEPLLEGSVELVLGVRPRPARVAEWLFSRYARLQFGIPDILCGVKAFALSVYRARRQAAEQHSINTALALAAVRAGESFALVPVAVLPRVGRPRFGGAWRANWRILGALAGAVVDDLIRR